MTKLLTCGESVSLRSRMRLDQAEALTRSLTREPQVYRKFLAREIFPNLPCKDHQLNL